MMEIKILLLYFSIYVDAVHFSLLLMFFYSNVIVQIVDARNPLLFRCEDLETYVKEVSKSKVNVILINKSDFLTCDQRYLLQMWFAQICLAILWHAIMHILVTNYRIS